MIRFSALPKITFVQSGGGSETIDLSTSAGLVTAAAQHLSAHAPPGTPVGIMLPSGPGLVIAWLAALRARLRPLILQYPNARQNRAYWAESVAHTARLVGLKLIVSDPACIASHGEWPVPVLAWPANGALAPVADAANVIPSFEILQLSSGTTGFRKAIRFKSKDLLRHVQDFDQTLRLTKADRIVSWLPLYHDMGFIACFVMPLLLGIDVVMIDPAIWVREPGLLFRAIEDHGGSICYMPNFGFEVMCAQPAPALASMRWWISCSEPVAAATVRKFLAHTGTPVQRFAACYAMAENIFAVTFGAELRTLGDDPVGTVSCGAPIAGVDVKVVEGEVWVRSPVSLAHYVGGADIRDADGYYATGDLGQLIDGQLYVAGRKHDLLIQAGRKFFLSDIDQLVNQIMPDVRGRAAAVAIRDARLATEVPHVLIERKDFFQRDDAACVADQLRARTSIDQLVVRYVPPRFITKTTSGKVNRVKTAADWLAHERFTSAAPPRADFATQIRLHLGQHDAVLPASEVLDSLSLSILQMLLSEAAIAYDPALSLGDFLRQAAPATATPAVSATAVADTIRIVAISDRILYDRLTEADLQTLAARVGHRVTFEQISLPPSAILLSDAIFQDYFRPRLPPEGFETIDAVWARVRDASLLLLDDSGELFQPPALVYGVLSHALQRDPRADLISVRWQTYSLQHDQVPLSLVAGRELPLSEASETSAALSAYLGIPMVRIANFQGFAPYTEDWEWRPLRGHGAPFAPTELVERMQGWIEDLGDRLRLSSAAAGNPVLNLTDTVHFCSHMVKPEAIEAILQRFSSFYIAGVGGSLPYVRRRLEELGKPYTVIPGYAHQALRASRAQHECVLICGAMGRYDLDLPAFALQHVAAPWRARNVDGELAYLNDAAAYRVRAKSGTDWYHLALGYRGEDLAAWRHVREQEFKGEAG
jgi:acyl-CoA synthetase (AMP-forming)/AMP-acid ligase II